MKRRLTSLKTCRSFEGKEGFFLLEAIVALGIFSIAILGLSAAVGHILDAERELRLLQRTRIELESQLATVAASRLQPGSVILESPIPGVELVRLIEILEPQNDEGDKLKFLYKITVTAKRKGDATQQLLDSAWVFIYQPR